MNDYSPIWPAQLDHLCIETDDITRMVGFYVDVLGMTACALNNGDYLLQAPQRRLVIRSGPPGGRPFHGFRVQHPAQLQAIRAYLGAKGLQLEDSSSPSPLFRDDSVAVRDPDGWLTVFGLPRPELPSLKAVNAIAAQAYPARLQHVVVASNNLPAMMDFYENTLGFVPSDYVNADETIADSKRVAFYRSDHEHHSFAVFHASSVRADHHSFEVSCWNDIRDWADHLANLQIPIWWGPGRHGPGNNLFFMIKDPHGQPLEFSAEIESMPREMAARVWPMNERSLNLWGPGWIRE
jgi:catechol 2,3-dioxygenase-like lactoylglutathione lyase family enzyme